MRTIISVLFLFLCLTAQGQFATFEPSAPPPPLRFNNSQGTQQQHQQNVQQWQQQEQQRRQQQTQQQPQQARITGVLVPHVGNPANISLVIRIVQTATGERYQLVQYRTPNSSNWVQGHNANAGFCRNQGAYFFNTVNGTIFFVF